MVRSVSIAGICAIVVLMAAFFIYRHMVGPGGDAVVGAHDGGGSSSTTTTAQNNGNGANGGAVDAGPGAAPAVPETAEIIAARGKVEARAGEKGPWNDAGVGQKLNTDDAVRAGRNGEATLRMGN